MREKAFLSKIFGGGELTFVIALVLLVGTIVYPWDEKAISDRYMNIWNTGVDWDTQFSENVPEEPPLSEQGENVGGEELSGDSGELEDGTVGENNTEELVNKNSGEELSGDSGELEDGTVGEDNTEELVNKNSEEQKALKAAEDGITIYYAVPTEWTKNGYTIYANGQQSKTEDKWMLIQMSETGALYNDTFMIYTATMPKTMYGGFDLLKFMAYAGAYNNDNYRGEVEAFSAWKSEADLDGKLYTGTEWINYTPVNPNDHTAFAGEEMYFENMSGTLDVSAGVNAVFYEKDAVSGEIVKVADIPMEKVTDKRFKVTIPKEACSYVQFVSAADNTIIGSKYSNFYGQDEQNPDVKSFKYNSKNMYTFRYFGSTADWGTIGATTVYYDATLSKMSYVGDDKAMGVGKEGIPYASDTVNYYAEKADGTSIFGAMKKVDAKESPGGKWTDVYSVDLPEGYTKIRFAAWKVVNKDAALNGDGTDMQDIPTKLARPCFYGDSGDKAVYTGGNRGGYWEEVYTIRDAEKGKGNTVVDIPVHEGYKRATDQLYIQATLYDFYTDYELNGNNRDTYDSNVVKTEHRIYQPFRHFNQALSEYYRTNSAGSPLYWGNFQNFKGSHFTEISDNLNLFDFNKDGNTDQYKKFFYENNSMWGRNGIQLAHGANATQGLVADSLQGGKMALKTTTGQVIPAPFFDKEFLEGKNAKNTVLGKVYENVMFPFVKKEVGNAADGFVDYWYFDSAADDLANKHLQLCQNTVEGYFLESQTESVKGVTTDGITAKTNYFPFNTSAQSGNAGLLNYGFGQKLELKFRLTSDGTVKTTTGKAVPIEFNFNGDDDVWVYIDDQLVLDIGGGHGAVQGKINFAERESWVASAKNAQGGGFTPNVTTAFPAALKDDTDFYKKEHTLKLFYVERGIWESNMLVSFNFPDENEFAVEKEVNIVDVNELFKGVFNNISVFPFTIQNQATHYGTKEVVIEGEEAKPITFHAFADAAGTNSTISKVSPDNTFEYVAGLSGQQGVVHWKALYDDIPGTYKGKRFGVMQPQTGGTIDVSKAKQYLKFKFYYDFNDNPSLANIYLELEDGTGKKIGGYLSGKTYGASNLTGRKWNTIQVDLSKLAGDAAFDFASLKNVKFNYNYERDIYLDDFIFMPDSSAISGTGFVTKQYEIPDYGSAASGKLEYPQNAIFKLTTVGSEQTSLHRIGEEGTFALANGQTATFSDAFRRGSYIAVTEDVDADVFDTTWTMYENEQAVINMEPGTTINNVQSVNVNQEKGTSIKDGRQEIYKAGTVDGIEYSNGGYQKTDWAKDSAGNYTENTIVFRSYAAPDGEMLTKLKVKFINKVKTGSIRIKKDKAADSPDLTGKYTFQVTFINVAGMSLESAPIVKEYTIKAGETFEIKGIPVNTEYMISEIAATDGATLEKVEIADGHNDTVSYNAETKTVSGVVKEDTEEFTWTNVIFKNTTKPKVSIMLEKKWEKPNGITLPASIKICLERSLDSGVTWEPVIYQAGADDPAVILKPDIEGRWRYEFKDLDRYVDATATVKEPWLYRVVELDAKGNPVASGGYLDKNFKVSYSDALSFPEKDPADTAPIDEIFTITNKYSPKTKLRIEKQDASNQDKRLGGVIFKLEKKNADNTYAAGIEVTTGSDETNKDNFGIAVFEELEEGTYRLTEIKTAEGYVLLKSPIIIVIDRTNGCTIQEGESAPVDITVKEDTISLTITNRLKFELPVTGGSGNQRMKTAGTVLAGIAVLMIVHQLRRKKKSKIKL